MKAGFLTIFLVLDRIWQILVFFTFMCRCRCRANPSPGRNSTGPGSSLASVESWRIMYVWVRSREEMLELLERIFMLCFRLCLRKRDLAM